MDSSERGMNPVSMTIINPREEYWQCGGSNQRPPVLKSETLPSYEAPLCVHVIETERCLSETEHSITLRQRVDDLFSDTMLSVSPFTDGKTTFLI